jgi:drug/metabolite transporter (DMT)-like permease
MHGNDRKYWLDDPANVTKLYRGVWVVGVLLVALDLVLQRHDDLGFAETWGFYALYGFVGIVSLVLTAKGLRRLVKRPEDFYER